VAILNWICWLDNQGKVDIQMLLKRTSYFAYLVFKLEDGFYVLRNVKAVFRFVDSESDHVVETRAKVVHFLGRGPRARLPLKRGDG